MEAASSVETLCFGAAEFWRIPLREGTGGSAMPWGLVFPAASAKLAAGDWLPEVRDAAAVNSYTLSVALSTIQMWLTLAGSIVMPVGLPPPELIVQLPTSEPAIVYLKTLSVELSLTTHRCTPLVTTSFGLVLPLLSAKLLAAFWLPDKRVAAPV